MLIHTKSKRTETLKKEIKSMKTLGNIIWVVFGKMHFRLAKLALSPFVKELS